MRRSPSGSHEPFTEDLAAITVPALITRGDDGQVVPHEDPALKQHELLKNADLRVHEGHPYGLLTTHADVIDPTPPDLRWLRSDRAARRGRASVG